MTYVGSKQDRVTLVVVVVVVVVVDLFLVGLDYVKYVGLLEVCTGGSRALVSRPGRHSRRLLFFVHDSKQIVCVVFVDLCVEEGGCVASSPMISHDHGYL
jgi:hypothetical protein